jgi:hypothetical protein
MKLLRDFFRLRAPRRSPSVARRDARRRVYVVTVPAPLATPAAKSEARAAAPLSSPRHLQLAH